MSANAKLTRFRFLDVNEMYNTAEAELWNLNERSENIQKIADLWKFEAVNAVAYQKRIKQELREEKRVRFAFCNTCTGFSR